jgi:putative molybdopterin biosynthesis protein
MLPGQDLKLINLTYRMQGWIVPAGNPEGISSIIDLTDTEKGFINRQKGAGTRLLFDHLLKEAGLSPLKIKGYEREEHTHLNVAAAIAAGTASVGLGILPAARAFGLDFVPLVEERYDLLLSSSFLKTPEAALLLKVIADPTLISEVEALGGYNMRDAGQLIEI